MDRAPRFSRRDTLKAGAAIAAAGALATPLAAQWSAKLKLRLLETSDLHVNVVPYDYFRDAPDEVDRKEANEGSSVPPHATGRRMPP